MNNNKNSIQQYKSLLPDLYKKTSETNVVIDNKPFILTRYTRKDNRNNLFLGEHFSIITTTNNKLQGFYYLDKKFEKLNMLSKEQSKDIALKFLKDFASDLLSDFSIHWIEQHDENIEDNGQSTIISGMKVKMHNNKDGTWFWVVVSGNGEIIIFERDIVWINFPGHRQTEKWLHDSWYIDNSNKNKVKQ